MMRDTAITSDERLKKNAPGCFPLMKRPGQIIYGLFSEGVVKAEHSENQPDDAMEGGGDRTEVFSYCLCAVCPLKESRPALGFFPSENALKSLMANRVLTAPELGFLFPSFEDRAANIYDLLYYTKSAAENHPEFIEQVAHTAVPMPADAQKETLQGILEESLSEDCSLKLAVELRDAICEQLEAAKTEDIDEPPVVTKHDVSRVLRDSGVKEERIQTFEDKYTEVFGDAALPPKNLVNTRAIEVATPDVQIKVNSDRSDLISTRTIDGVRYILIRAENGVEVSGMNVNIAVDAPEEPEEA